MRGSYRSVGAAFGLIAMAIGSAGGTGRLLHDAVCRSRPAIIVSSPADAGPAGTRCGYVNRWGRWRSALRA